MHGYYWNDDEPMTYFADVRDRPAYCSAHLVPLQSLPSDLATAASTPDFAIAVTPDGRTVYAVGGDSDAVIPISAAARRPGPGIRVGYSPAAIAISRSGATAYVVNTISSTVTPVSTTTSRAGRPIPVGSYSYPTAIALAPSGSTAVVVDTYGGQVTLLDTGTQRPTAQITVGGYPVAVAFAN